MVTTEINIYDELADFLASMNPKKVLQFKASKKAQERMEHLLWKNREGQLTNAEKEEIERYLVVERIVRLAKIHAEQRLRQA